MNTRIGLTVLSIAGLLLGCGEAEAEAEEGVELGVYALSPGDRNFHIELRDDGTFRATARESDLDLYGSGVWSVEGDSVTRLLPAEDHESFAWSTPTGFTGTDSVRLEAEVSGETIAASFVDPREDTETTQRFVRADDFPAP